MSYLTNKQIDSITKELDGVIDMKAIFPGFLGWAGERADGPAIKKGLNWVNDSFLPKIKNTALRDAIITGLTTLADGKITPEEVGQLNYAIHRISEKSLDFIENEYLRIAAKYQLMAVADFMVLKFG